MMQKNILKNADNASGKEETSQSEKSSQRVAKELVQQHRCEEYFCCEQSSFCNNGKKCCIDSHSTR